MFNIQGIKQDKLQIDITEESDKPKLIFKGDLDMADPGPLLDPFFDSIHKQILADSVPLVILDFDGLNFLNSSGIKTIAKWIMKLSVLPDEQQYKIIIRQNKAITWQTTSLPTLTFLVPGIVHVE